MHRVMKVTVFLSTFLTVLWGQFTPDDSTRLSYPISAFSPKGELQIQKRDVYLDTVGKKGSIKRRLTVTFDAATGHYLVEYSGLGHLPESGERDKSLILSDDQRKLPDAGIYVSEREILRVMPTVFKLNGCLYAALQIVRSSEKATSLDDAERQAIRMLTTHAAEAAAARNWTPTPGELITLQTDALFERPTPDHPWGTDSTPVDLMDIAQSADGWAITFRAEYTVRMMLSPEFESLKAVRIDSGKR
jgi:hypothetical protein